MPLRLIRGLAPLSLLAGLIFSTAAPAADASGEFAVRGIGAQTCAALLAGTESDKGAVTLQHLSIWASGYLSHANRASQGIFDAMPIQDSVAIAQIVTHLCRDNTDILVENVMAKLVQTLASVAPTAPSELDTIKNGSYSVVIRRSVMTAVQNRLVALDLLDAAAVDGLYGAKSQTALSKYQESRKLAVTGVPDAATVLRILIESR